MPRFYFHFRDVDGLDRNQEGFDLPALADAQVEAHRITHEMRDVWDDLLPEDLNTMAIEVADKTGQTVFIMRLSEVVGANH